MLSVRGLRVRFEDADRDAVADVDLDLPTGHVLAVLGPSGSGKSTLLRAVAGLEAVRAGNVVWDGEDLTAVPTHRRGFALMFQDGQLFAHQSVAGNVGYPLRLRHRPRAEVRGRVAELLELVGLTDLGGRRVGGLSGGERQRVALARALAVEPRLLLLDEPLSALDRGLRERLAQDLRDILLAAGTTALLVTHDQDEAFAVADRMALMRQGRLVQAGSLDEVWSRPVDAEAARFLGYASVLFGTPATRVLRAAGVRPRADDSGEPLALRRSALVLDPAGALDGRVVAVRATPQSLRLVVDVDGVGTLEAVAGSGGAPPVVGELVAVRVDLARTARVGGPDRAPRRS